LILGSAVFVPLLIIAIVRFESVAIAFAVAATFSVGAMVGFFLSMLVAGLVIPMHHDDLGSTILVFIFASGGAIGGAAIALSLLRRIAGDRPWRRR
jgi:predicted permease